MKNWKDTPKGTRIYEKNSVIIKEGEKDDTIFFLKSGKVGVYKGDKQIGIISKTGESFGEISAILGIPRSATCIALEEVEVYAYTGGIEKILKEHQTIARRIIEVLAERLVITDQKIIETGRVEISIHHDEGKPIVQPQPHPQPQITVAPPPPPSQQPPQNGTVQVAVGGGFIESDHYMKILKADVRSLQRSLMLLDEATLAKALWATRGELKQTIAQNISRRKIEMVNDIIEKFNKEPPTKIEGKTAVDKIQDYLAQPSEQSAKPQKK